LEADARIFVAGHRGLVGSALVRRLSGEGYKNILTKSHAELDLTNQAAVRHFMQESRPDYVLLAAAKVGGILANDTHPAEFIAENLAIQNNVIHEAWRCGVKRLLFLGSSCIYPRDCPQPIREAYLLTGPLEPTNRAYAVAKIAGVEMCSAYNREYGTQYICAMPTNLYGPGDNYDLANSHVLPALIRKTHEAKQSHAADIVVWGTGKPRREFLHSDDAADACVFLLNMDDERLRKLVHAEHGEPPLINIGCGKDQTIFELAQLIQDVVGFNGRLRFDSSKPDGTMQKLLDVTLLGALGWRPKISLRQGIERTYADFRTRDNAASLQRQTDALIRNRT
jgi:GDP-L-fucose synthase